MRAALVEAVHAAEGRVAAQYQAALAEAAAEVEEEQALEVGDNSFAADHAALLPSYRHVH